MTRSSCCSPETKGIIVASLEVTGGILGVIYSGLVIGIFNFIVRWDLNDSDAKGPQNSGENSGNEADKETPPNGAQWVLSIITFVFMIFLLISILQIIISSALIHGIRKRSFALLIVWMIFKIIFMVFLVMAFVPFYFIATLQQMVYYSFIFGFHTYSIKVICDIINQPAITTDELPNLVKCK